MNTKLLLRLDELKRKDFLTKEEKFELKELKRDIQRHEVEYEPYYDVDFE